jgi:hypothetical protein
MTTTYHVKRRRYLKNIMSQTDFVGFHCHYCNIPLIWRDGFGDHYYSRLTTTQQSNDVTIDHLHPVGRDGSLLDMDNWRVCCMKCNQMRNKIDKHITMEDKIETIKNYSRAIHRQSGSILHPEFSLHIFKLRLPRNFVNYG